jgi:hypothetical protein
MTDESAIAKRLSGIRPESRSGMTVVEKNQRWVVQRVA